MSAPYEFAVDDPHAKRFEAALELLREGKPVTYRGIILSLPDSQVLDCAVVTGWRHPQNVTREMARTEMLAGKTEVEKLTAESAAFASLVGGRRALYSLISWDGMCYTQLASLDE